MTRTITTALAIILLATPVLAWDDEAFQRRVEPHMTTGSGWSGSARAHESTHEMFEREADDRQQRARDAAIAAGASTAGVPAARIESAVRALQGGTRELRAWMEEEDARVARERGGSSALGTFGGAARTATRSELELFEREDDPLQGARETAAQRHTDTMQRLHGRALEADLLGLPEEIVDDRPPSRAVNPHPTGGSGGGGGSDRNGGFDDPGGAPNLGNCNCGR